MTENKAKIRIKEGLEDEWTALRRENIADEYVLDIISATENVGRRLEKDMEDGLEIDEGRVERYLDDEYLTQAMKAGVLRLLRTYWAFSEELRWT